MDVIGEDQESDFGGFMDVGPEINNGGVESQYVMEEVDVDVSESGSISDSVDVSDSEEGEFTKQLRKQRKQVLEEGGIKKQVDFSQRLRKHREHLVNSWEEDQDQDGEHVQDLPNTSSQDNEMNGDTVVTDGFGDFTEGTISDNQRVNSSDEDFGTVEDAPSEPLEQEKSVEAIISDDDDEQYFDAIPNDAEDDTSGNVGSAPIETQPASNDGDDDFFAGLQPAASTESGASLPASKSNRGDDFGDFGAALSQPQQKQEQTNGGEVLGDFGATPAQQEQTIGGDDFGDFGAAPTQPQEEQAYNAGGDDFGDFGAAPSEPQLMEQDDDNEAPPQSQQEADDANDFGHFGGAPVVPQPEQASNDDDDVGDFGEDPTQPQEGQQPNDDDEDFGDFDAAPSAPQLQQADEGDNLGEAPSQPQQEKTQDDDDDFGDFGTAPPQEEEANDDDDFGDFGAAPAASQPEQVSAEDDDFGVAPSQPQNEQANDGDDFGDFDETPSAPQTEQTADGEDFGDFGVAPFQPEQNRTDDNDDDDFGDFDAAPTPEQANDDDDFGDFGEAPSQAQQEKINDDDDDDFGDFDAAPSAAHGAEADDEDDFGDFDAAPSEAKSETQQNQPTTEDDFGDFDGPSQSQSATPAHQASAPFTAGPEMQNTKAIFAHMQTKYSFQDVDDPSDDDAYTELKEFSLQKFMVCSSEGEGKTDGNFGAASLAAALKDTRTHKEPFSKIIIENDGRSLFYHLAFPVGGLQAPDDEAGTKPGKRSSAVTSQLPDMLPIQLPTGTQMPLDAASPSIRRKKTLREEPDMPALPGLGMENGTRVALPTLPSDVNSRQRDGSSAVVQQLLSRIPDLSFMLQSSLVLPKK